MNELLLLQFLVLAVGLVLPVCATVRLLRFPPAGGVLLPLWLLFVWLVPVAGSLCILLARPRRRTPVA